MKALLPKSLAIILFFAFVLPAQSQVLTIQEQANWQQYISTILGGSCLQISDVNYNSTPQSAARFINGAQAIGLDKGIVITTGTTDGIAQHPVHFLSTFNFTPGDPHLTALAGSTTRDASSLSFQFQSPVSDTVRIRYVFASEEYPEFVNSSFNDVFAFWVTDQLGVVTNIATLPSGNIPITINTINQWLNGQYYVAGHPQCAYDGFTVPLTAKFYAQAGQTYLLRIAIADGGDGIYDSAVFLESFFLSTQSMHGVATVDGAPAAAGEIRIYGLNTDSTQANLVGSYDLSEGGEFLFTGVEPGSYILQFIPDPVLYPNAWPKYFNNAFLWEDATILSFPCDDYSTDVPMMPGLSGNGAIGGTVYSTTSTLRSTALIEDAMPISGVSIWLLDMLTLQPLAHAYTQQDGAYQFNNVPAGQYRVSVDVPGIGVEDAYELTLENGATVSSLDYLVGLNKIIPFDGSSVDLQSIPDLHVMGNPVNDVLQVSAQWNGTVQYRIFDLSGRAINSGMFTATQQGVHILDVHHLIPGYYIFLAEHQGKQGRIRFVKQ